jgi:hypothetical protein
LIILSGHLVVVELDEEEYVDEGIEVAGVLVNPE